MKDIYTPKGIFYQPQWMPEMNVSNPQEQYLIPRLGPTISPSICTAAIDWKTVGSEVNLQKMILTINLLSSGFAQLIARDPGWKIEASDHQVCAQKNDKSISLSVQELLEIQKQSAAIGLTLECPIWAGATESEAKECMNHSLKNAAWAIANKPSELALFVHLPYHQNLLKPACQVLANQRFQGIALSGLPSEIEPIKQAIDTIAALNKPVHLLGVKQDLARPIMDEYDFVTVSSSEWIDQAQSGQLTGYSLKRYPSDDELTNLALCNIANIQKTALPIFLEVEFTSWFWVPWLQSMMRESKRVN